MTTKNFTVRIPEHFFDFKFDIYDGESIEDKDIKELLAEQAYDASLDYEIEVYDEHGFQVALPEASEPEESDEPLGGSETRGPGTNPEFYDGSHNLG